MKMPHVSLPIVAKSSAYSAVEPVFELFSNHFAEQVVSTRRLGEQEGQPEVLVLSRGVTGVEKTVAGQQTENRAQVAVLVLKIKWINRSIKNPRSILNQMRTGRMLYLAELVLLAFLLDAMGANVSQPVGQQLLSHLFGLIAVEFV